MPGLDQSHVLLTFLFFVMIKALTLKG